MEIKYTILGADGLEYGPVALEQLKAWMREGRLAADTQVLRSDTNSWRAAAQYAELGLAAPPIVVPGGVPPSLATRATAMENPELLRRMRSGGEWFYWIAGFSVVNQIMAFVGIGAQFIIGMAMTYKLQAFVWRHHLGGNVGEMAVPAIIAGVFILLGVYAGKGQTWAFAVGFLLYLIDTLLCLYLSVGILMVGFHAYVLFCVGRGLWANWRLRVIIRGEMVNP